MKLTINHYSAAMLTIITAIWSYWTFYPFGNIVTIKNPEAIEINGGPYRPGDHISYTMSYCKTLPIEGHITRAIIDGTRIPFADIYSNLKVGCHTITSTDLVVPGWLTPGIYHLEGNGEYIVNPIRKDINTWRSEDFEIIR